MSHHYSGPDFGFPHGDARLDFTDLYAFPKPGDASRSIVIMNVHPEVSFQPPGSTTATPFLAEALYEIKIAVAGDVHAGITFSVRFSGDGEEQTATLRRVDGFAAAGTGANGRAIVEDAPVSTGHDARVTTGAGYRFFAGRRSDPFFFDTIGAVNDLHFTGSDYFIDKNVCSIVLDIPNSELGSGILGLWARTLDGRSGTWIQADRGAKPSQTPFLTGDHNAEYLAAQPADDARFIPVFAHALEHAGGYLPQEAEVAAALLLPDMLCYAPAQDASYPVNGRALTDDASGHFLAILTNGKITSSGVPPHTDLLEAFPYVGPPHARG